MNYFGPQGPRAASQPSGQETNVRYGAGDTWVQDCTTANSNDGTVLNAAFFNNIIGNLNNLVIKSNLSDPAVGDMTMVYRAVMTLATDAVQGYVTETQFIEALATLVTTLELSNALSSYAPLKSPIFNGNPTAPTVAGGDASDSLATTRFVANALGAAVRTGRTVVHDANYQVLATDAYVGMVTLTAARTISLPAASTYLPGQPLAIADESGACSAALALTLLASGTDTIAGQSSILMASPYQLLTLYSNSVNLWTL